MGLSVVSSTAVLAIRDEEHALSLLREAVGGADEGELRQLAQDVVDGRMLVMRLDAAHELDDVSDAAAAAPLLSELATVEGLR